MRNLMSMERKRRQREEMRDFDCGPVDHAPGGKKPSRRRKDAGRPELSSSLAGSLLSLKEIQRSIVMRWTPSLLNEEVNSDGAKENDDDYGGVSVRQKA
mmetsp:Transcript_55542/g.118115  ORF Transcript_55542/g.118115 Transcript_55542/m.118115 type:complete len:99 (+) Transcript_55542:366-662(+)